MGVWMDLGTETREGLYNDFTAWPYAQPVLIPLTAIPGDGCRTKGGVLNACGSLAKDGLEERKEVGRYGRNVMG